MKNNYNQKKIDKQYDYLTNQYEEYIKELDRNDLADKGYRTGEQLQQCHDNNITTLVAIPKRGKQNDNSKPEHLTKENFSYDKNSSTYTCPQGHVLDYQNTYKRKNKGRIVGAPFDRYKMDWNTCSNCPQFNDCVSKGNKSRKQGRYIDRNHTDKVVEKNKRLVEKNKKLYRTRQEIVERPFGTIKRHRPVFCNFGF